MLISGPQLFFLLREALKEIPPIAKFRTQAMARGSLVSYSF
jgi:hypothetical protein